MQIPLTGGCQCGKLRYELSKRREWFIAVTARATRDAGNNTVNYFITTAGRAGATIPRVGMVRT
jgi:hypothetical protein